jgi:hypothetical protein
MNVSKEQPAATATTTPQECAICVNSFTKKNNPIQCPTCYFTACFQCYKHYIADNPTNKAQCIEPSCKKEFSQHFLYQNFKKTFVRKDYNRHLQELYFQKESARLPETQALIVLKEKHANRLKEIHEVLKTDPENNYLQYLRTFYTHIQSYDTYSDETTEPTAITSEEECYEFIDNYLEYGSIYGDQLLNPAHPNHTQHTKEYAHQYHGKCPVTNCRGFITNEFLCGICHIQVCRDCHIPIDSTNESTHTCDPDTIESIKSISKETKPCPTCHVPIYKLEGCSQMWCVQCHTAFSWTTGEIETQIHNPHYYEWMFSQANTQQPQQDPLELLQDTEPPRLLRQFGNTTPWRLHEILREKFTIMIYKINYSSPPPFEQTITELQFARMIQLYYSLCQSVYHLLHVRYRELQAEPVGRLETIVSGIREKYLRNIITEKQFKETLLDIYKEHEYKEKIDAIIQLTYIENIKHIFENYLHDVVKHSSGNLQTLILDYNQQLLQTVMNADEEMERCAEVYGYQRFYKLVIKQHRVTLCVCRFSQKKATVDTREFLQNSFDFN